MLVGLLYLTATCLVSTNAVNEFWVASFNSRNVIGNLEFKAGSKVNGAVAISGLVSSTSAPQLKLVKKPSLFYGTPDMCDNVEVMGDSTPPIVELTLSYSGTDKSYSINSNEPVQLSSFELFNTTAIVSWYRSGVRQYSCAPVLPVRACSADSITGCPTNYPYEMAFRGKMASAVINGQNKKCDLLVYLLEDQSNATYSLALLPSGCFSVNHFERVVVKFGGNTCGNDDDDNNNVPETTFNIADGPGLLPTSRPITSDSYNKVEKVSVNGQCLETFVDCNSLMLSSKFNHLRNVVGSIDFRSVCGLSPTFIQLRLTISKNSTTDSYPQWSTLAKGWHVHKFPRVALSNVDDGGQICAGPIVGGHFNPYGKAFPLDAGLPADQYEIGDLSGRLPPLSDLSQNNAGQIETKLADFNSRIWNLFGRSITIHRPDNAATRWICADLYPAVWRSFKVSFDGGNDDFQPGSLVQIGQWIVSDDRPIQSFVYYKLIIKTGRPSPQPSLYIIKKQSCSATVDVNSLSTTDVYMKLDITFTNGLAQAAVQSFPLALIDDDVNAVGVVPPDLTGDGSGRPCLLARTSNVVDDGDNGDDDSAACRLCISHFLAGIFLFFAFLCFH